ncbi:Oxygen-independent coproporphyrinogen III oxidase [Thermobrachium celere DSM 8682]|uniref:Oxygen-independent coproporphyrinogen III oxidase n=1 Tax=Thermobrachium celere DSM 8682 TaxID=941824 RepID=R7RRM7_9CLOT|nr:Oxygen-independent coproporphyrinogen III oxidase [Thermobrachium celere DSM 8682]
MYILQSKKITGQIKDITPEDADNIIKQHLSTIKREDSYIEVSFFGGSFTAIEIDKQNELLEVSKKYLDMGLIDAVRLSTRPDYIDDNILTNLKKYGVKNIELGVQSMDDEVLKKLCRGHTSFDVVRASILIKKYGFNLGLQMMVGAYGDTYEKDIYTANKIVELRPNFVRIYPTLVIKDTYLEVLYKSGMYKPLELDEAVKICKELYKIFYKNEIYILRIGLQASEELTLGKSVIAGPFHPAFRELVESSILNEMIYSIIKNDFSEASNLELQVNQQTLSKIYSDKKRYFNDLLRQISNKIIKIKQNQALNTFEILLKTNEKCKKMSLFEYIISQC